MAKQSAEEHPVTVEAVLAGRASYDDLATDEEQAAVRAAWGVRIARRREGSYEMTAELEARGTQYYSADAATGAGVEHIPGVGARPYAGPAGGGRASDKPAR